MSFSLGKTIGFGDLVVFYISPIIMVPVVLEETGTMHLVYGSFIHAELVGKPFGSKVPSIVNYFLFP